jgi:hypothetical protein
MKAPILRMLAWALCMGYCCWGMAQSTAHTEPYVDPKPTGNAAADEKAHIEAKTAWIKANPEEYRKAGGNPEAVLNPVKTDVASPRTFVEGPAFSAQKTFTLASSQVLLQAGAKASATEITTEESAFKNNLPIGKARLEKGVAGALRLFVPGDFDLRATEVILADGAVEWKIQSRTCETCNKVMRLRLIENANGILTYEMNSEDEISPFKYRFTFKQASN